MEVFVLLGGVVVDFLGAIRKETKGRTQKCTNKLTNTKVIATTINTRKEIEKTNIARV